MSRAFLHGIGRPRIVDVLEVGANADSGRVLVRDATARSVDGRPRTHWVASRDLSHSPRADRRP